MSCNLWRDRKDSGEIVEQSIEFLLRNENKQSKITILLGNIN